MIPHRQVYWNIPHHSLLYLPFAAMALVFLYGIWRHVAVWRMGKRGPLTDPWRRVGRVLSHGLGQARVPAGRTSGVAHAVLFFAYGLMTVGTFVVALNADLGLPVMQGPFYLYFESLGLDVAGVAAIAALLALMLRRRPGRPTKASPMDLFLLLSLLVVLISGFVIESLRLYVTAVPWAGFSPVGHAMALGWGAVHLSAAAALTLHRAIWWGHMLLAFAFMGAWPYSRLMHILFAPVAIFLSDPTGLPPLPEVDLESEETLGINAVSDLTVKDLVDLDACTDCGRCDEVCPANQTGGPLSPRRIILDLKEHVARTPKAPFTQTISDEALFACTTCRACMQVCPVDIEHVPKIVGMRQFRTMEQAAAPPALQEALESMEVRGHPFRGAPVGRDAWYSGIEGVSVWREGERCELLLWVGCAATFDARTQSVARATVRLLSLMGQKVHILGEAEPCTGDLARRAGNEYLYQNMATEAAALLSRVAPEEIVVLCPHCLQQLNVEFRTLGLEARVVHHTTYLADALAKGRLSVPKGGAHYTYHDPCYLGRYGDVLDAPRELVQSAGVLTEMPRSGRGSFCCGGGGGGAFSATGGAPALARAREAAGTGAQVLATGCPFCLQMMTAGAASGAGARTLEVKDIAEILLERIEAGDKAGAKEGAGRV